MSGDLDHMLDDEGLGGEIGAAGDNIGKAAADQLKSVVARIERLEEDKAAVMADIKEVYAEAKSNGYDTKTLRKLVNLRKVDSHERQEAEALLELYMNAVGMY